jgi:exopolysaccharide biosynthesis polyprenyl glycosylphosphotransferase
MRSFKYFVKAIFMVALTIVQIVIFLSIWKVYQEKSFFNNLDKFWAVISSYIILVSMLSSFFGVYRIGHKRLLDIIFGQFATVGITNVLIYLQLSMIENWPYFYAIKTMLLVIFLNSLAMFLGTVILHTVYMILTPKVPAILIKEDDEFLLSDLERNRIDKRFILKEIIDINVGEDKIKEKIKDFKVVLLDDIPPYLRNNILKYCYENSIKCYAKPKISDILVRSAGLTNICFNSMMIYNNQGPTLLEKFIKRTFDIVLSLIALIILLPIFAIIAIIIKFTDGGPILYTQERYTKDSKIFKIYKFRSMYVHKKDVQMTTKNDKRITPIGAILRRTHFDELPQLVNILKGDMSIVGPRPEMMELYDLYCEEYPEYRYRLKMKAGLTGYAQVYGKYNTSPQDKLKFDLLYISNFSILLDIKIILLTVKVLFAKNTSEGIDEGKKNALKKKK